MHEQTAVFLPMNRNHNQRCRDHCCYSTWLFRGALVVERLALKTESDSWAGKTRWLSRSPWREHLTFLEWSGGNFRVESPKKTFLSGMLARTLHHSKFNTASDHQISLDSLYPVSAESFFSFSHTPCPTNCRTATSFALLWRPYHHQTWNSPIIVAAPLRPIIALNPAPQSRPPPTRRSRLCNLAAPSPA
jgi:hypothetical protein